jgi:hypothetical protein
MKSEAKNITTKAIALIAALAFLAFWCAGCSVTSARRSPDGTIVVNSFRCLWKTEAVRVDASYAPPQTFNLKMTVGYSASDDKSVGAVAEGAVKALTRP